MMNYAGEALSAPTRKPGSVRSAGKVAAGLYSRLNRWEWPEIDGGLRRRILIAIEETIGIGACLKDWRTRDDFDTYVHRTDLERQRLLARIAVEFKQG